MAEEIKLKAQYKIMCISFLSVDQDTIAFSKFACS